jgi:hypothetical protein
MYTPGAAVDGTSIEVRVELPGLYREVAAKHELPHEIQEMILRLNGESPSAAGSH